jgi:hypothetical protein
MVGTNRRWSGKIGFLQGDHNSEAPHKKLYTQHYSVLAMFLFLAVLSIVIGNYKLTEKIPVECFIMIDIVEAFVLVYLARSALCLIRHFHPPIARWLARRPLTNLSAQGYQPLSQQNRGIAATAPTASQPSL